MLPSELEGVEVGIRFDRNTFESRVELGHVPVAGLHGVVGLQWREDEFSALGEEAYVPETDSSDIGLFLVEDYHHGTWTYELGARVDWVDRDPDSSAAGSEDFVSYSLSGALLKQIGPAWSMGLALSQETPIYAYEQEDATFYGIEFESELLLTELLLFTKLKNIGDEEIRLSTSFLRNYAPESGRSLELGLRLLF